MDFGMNNYIYVYKLVSAEILNTCIRLCMVVFVIGAQSGLSCMYVFITTITALVISTSDSGIFQLAACMPSWVVVSYLREDSKTQHQSYPYLSSFGRKSCWRCAHVRSLIQWTSGSDLKTKEGSVSFDYCLVGKIPSVNLLSTCMQCASINV